MNGQIVQMNESKIAEEKEIKTEPGNRPHGAVQYPNNNGTFGYIYPVTSIRERTLKKIREEGAIIRNWKNYLPLSEMEYEEVCEAEGGKGFEREEGFDILVHYVKLSEKASVPIEVPFNNTNKEILPSSHETSNFNEATADQVGKKETKLDAKNDSTGRTQITNNDGTSSQKNSPNKKKSTTNTVKKKNSSKTISPNEKNNKINEEPTTLDMKNKTKTQSKSKPIMKKKKNAKTNATETPKKKQKTMSKSDAKSNIAMTNETIEMRNRSLSSLSTENLRILCAVHTSEERHHQVEAIINTWGWRCDGFFAASTLTNETLGTLNLAYFESEKPNNLWQKSRSIWAYIYDHYIDDFDFFWFSGDDVHVIVENLRDYLSDLNDLTNNDEPLYLGNHIPLVNGEYFVGGAPGYVLNRVAVKRLMEESLTRCFPFDTLPIHDRLMSTCFRKIGIEGADTTDSFGKQRFHLMDPEFLGSFDGKQGYLSLLYEYWGSKHGFKFGPDLVSNQSVSFHCIDEPISMKRHHALLYRTCPNYSRLEISLNFFEYLIAYNVSIDFLKFRMMQLAAEDKT